MQSRLCLVALLAGVRGVGVARVVGGAGGGSAFILGERTLVTCRHVFHPGTETLPDAAGDLGRVFDVLVLTTSGIFVTAKGQVVSVGPDVAVALLGGTVLRMLRRAPARMVERKPEPRWALFGFGRDLNGGWAYAATKASDPQLTPAEIARGAAMETYTIEPIAGLPGPQWGDSGAPVFRRWGPTFVLAGVLQYVYSAPQNQAGFIPLGDVLPQRSETTLSVYVVVCLLALTGALSGDWSVRAHSEAPPPPLPTSSALTVPTVRSVPAPPQCYLEVRVDNSFVRLAEDVPPPNADRVSVGSAATTSCKGPRATGEDLSRLKGVLPCVWLEDPVKEGYEAFARDGRVYEYQIGEPSPECAIVCRRCPGLLGQR